MLMKRVRVTIVVAASRAFAPALRLLASAAAVVAASGGGG